MMFFPLDVVFRYCHFPKITWSQHRMFAQGESASIFRYRSSPQSIVIFIVCCLMAIVMFSETANGVMVSGSNIQIGRTSLMAQDVLVDGGIVGGSIFASQLNWSDGAISGGGKFETQQGTNQSRRWNRNVYGLQRHL